VTAVDPDPDAFPIVYSVESVVFHKHSSTMEQVELFSAVFGHQMALNVFCYA
jgi:hypothetical protein